MKFLGIDARGASQRRRRVFAAVVFVVGLAWIGQMMWLVDYIIRVYPVPHPYFPLPVVGSLFRVIATAVFVCESLVMLPLYILVARAVYGAGEPRNG